MSKKHYARCRCCGYEVVTITPAKDRHILRCFYGGELHGSVEEKTEEKDRVAWNKLQEVVR